MEKKLLHSDKEYFDYCAVNTIGNIHRMYTSQSCYIDEDSSEPCQEYVKVIYDETMNIDRKPKQYPCVFVWDCEEGDHDIYSGMFVYPGDFDGCEKIMEE